jgi:hypothetical protein
VGSFESYRDQYPSVRMSRDRHGILEVVLHTKGNSLKWRFDVIEQFVRAFRDTPGAPDHEADSGTRQPWPDDGKHGEAGGLD